MKREIDGAVYDTADAKVIASHKTESPHIQRMSTLYQSGEGRYFVVEEQERYGVYGTLLTPLTDTMTREWLKNHGKADLAGSLFRKGRILLHIEIDPDMLRRIDAAAEVAGLSKEVWVTGAVKHALASVRPLVSASRGPRRDPGRL